MSEPEVHLQGAVLHVGDMEASIAFYGEALDLVVARRTEDAAVLATRSGTGTLAMRERHIQRVTDRTVQALLWRLPSLEWLGLLEQRLDRLGGTPTRHALPEDGLTLVTAWDPDGQRLVFLHSENDADVPQRIPPEVFWY